MRHLIRLLMAVCLIASFGGEALALKALWVTVSPTGNQVFATAEEACQRQHDAYAYSDPGPVTANRTEYWYMRICDWVTHTEASVPIAPLPTAVTLSCYNDDGTPQESFDYAIVPPQGCIPKSEGVPSRQNCSFDRGSQLNPVIDRRQVAHRRYPRSAVPVCPECRGRPLYGGKVARRLFVEYRPSMVQESARLIRS